MSFTVSFLTDALTELLKVKDDLIQFQGMNGFFSHHTWNIYGVGLPFCLSFTPPSVASGALTLW